LLPLVSTSQNYAPKDYYLVDSLNLDALTEDDQQIIETSLKEYHTAIDDTSKIIALNIICENMMHEDWSKYQFFQYNFIQEAINNNNNNPVVGKRLKELYSGVLNNIGIIYDDRGEVKKALEFYFKCIEIDNELKNKQGVASSYNNIGLAYKNQGRIEEGLNYYTKALKIQEEIGYKKGMAQSYNNIGVIHDEQGNLDIAFDYYLKSLEIKKQIGDKKGIALCYNNIGVFKNDKGHDSEALKYHFKSLELREEIGDNFGIATSLSNIGVIYYFQENYDLALEYYFKSLKIEKEIDDKYGILSSYKNIANVYLKLDKIEGEDGALAYATKGFGLAKEINRAASISEIAKLLFKIYEKQGNGLKALEMYKFYIFMHDSINNEATQKIAIQQQAKYEYEKQKAVDDAEHDKQIAIEQEAKEKQTILTYATGGGLGLVGIFLIFVFNRLQVTKKQKLVIELQKQEVEKQKEVVEFAHSELEEKNQEITDSIQYAKRIQNAILPPLKVVKEYLQESFILYKPKDIVAGDFYWMETIGDESRVMSNENPTLKTQHSKHILFAAADCTGHGVPGAMVSVVCNNGLNRSVREYGLTDPGEILNKTREIVVQEFEKSEEEVKDGMDIAICSLDGTTLKYAGAHNPLWIIRPRHSGLDPESLNDKIAGQARNDDYDLIEIKANKQPIGQFDNPEPYTTHTLELQKGDSLYIFSDGYADQFGGEKGKKLKTANFKKLLLSIQKENMTTQKQLIDEAFENWKGNLEQLDDVCVIGVRI
jgi:serine phosphatase RsbU (regulator of sigma subunit)/Tfp pilus assembly protein PilF